LYSVLHLYNKVRFVICYLHYLGYKIEDFVIVYALNNKCELDQVSLA